MNSTQVSGQGKRAASAPQQGKLRVLKIEEVGDPAKGCVWPMIRLKGRWLEALGLLAGGRCQITPLEEGLIELKFQPTSGGAR